MPRPGYPGPGVFAGQGGRKIDPIETRIAIFAKKPFGFLQIETVFGFSGIVLEGNVMPGVAAGGLVGG